MKRIFSILISLLALLPIQAQTEDDARIGQSLNNSDWFELRRAYEQADKETIMPMLKVFAESMIATQFNQPENASVAIRELINKYGNEIGMGNIINMGYLLASNEARLGKYTDAAQTLNNIIQTFEQYTDSTSLAIHRQSEKQYQILAQYEGINRITSPKEDYHFPFRLDSIGFKGKRAVTMMIPAEVNQKPQDIVFDTGAGVNIVSTKAVKELGLDLHEISTELTGVGGIQQGQFAVAQSIQLGNLTLNNVPFYVVDISSGIDSIDVHMKHLNMILGVDFIHAMKEIQINFEKKEIVVPQIFSTLQEGEVSNMTGGVADFVLEGKGNGERLLFLLDTGAGSSNLGSQYFQRHKEYITTQCQADTLRSAGGGGILIEQAYWLPDFCLETNGTSYTFPKIMVATQGGPTDTREGNFGMDYFLQFKKLIFNTKDMFVRMIK